MRMKERQYITCCQYSSYCLLVQDMLLTIDTIAKLTQCKARDPPAAEAMVPKVRGTSVAEKICAQPSGALCSTWCISTYPLIKNA